MSKKSDGEYSSFSAMEKVFGAEVLLHKLQSSADRHAEHMARFPRLDNLRMRVKESRAGSLEHWIYALVLKFFENDITYFVWVESKIGLLFVARCVWSMIGLSVWVLVRAILVMLGFVAAAAFGVWLLYQIFLS